MPCYSPPPPYEGKAKANAEAAARILCDMVSRLVAENKLVSSELLEWWCSHREIDLEKLTCWKSKLTPQEQAEAKKIRKDITWAYTELKRRGYAD